jgi:hypothetical protein
MSQIVAAEIPGDGLNRNCHFSDVSMLQKKNALRKAAVKIEFIAWTVRGLRLS